MAQAGTFRAMVVACLIACMPGHAIMAIMATMAIAGRRLMPGVPGHTIARATAGMARRNGKLSTG